MNRQKMDSLHKTALNYGQWARFGGDSCGVGSGHMEITTKRKLRAPRRRRLADMERLGVTPTQPKQTRQQPASIALMYKTHPRYERIHRIARHQPEPIQHIIILLYYMAKPFRDVRAIVGLTSRQVGDMKSYFLNAISV